MNVDNALNDVRHKIHVVKENIGGKYRYPKEILIILSLREVELQEQLYFLKS